ncbi:hypothetical protein OSB04_003946 [Centaurea solstitialis]|uniref:Uncharacterized protein n=1 Tax=Centaurea solstitialis TaxID=347529 RepID=A0AA38WU17_9ASTR|nr:hypothetical protein OSB04_003946 [Centaurea solstitialis]
MTNQQHQLVDATGDEGNTTTVVNDVLLKPNEDSPPPPPPPPPSLPQQVDVDEQVTVDWSVRRRRSRQPTANRRVRGASSSDLSIISDTGAASDSKSTPGGTVRVARVSRLKNRYRVRIPADVLKPFKLKVDTNSAGSGMGSFRSPLGSDNLKNKAWTFFFSNFPENESDKSMWKTFECLGVVVDLYIAKKLNRWGKRFGFVRFIRVNDWRSLERALNGIWIGSHKLLVNLAKFNRSKPRRFIGERSKDCLNAPKSSPKVCDTNATNQKVSYADVVKGSRKDETQSEFSGRKREAKLEIIPLQDTLSKLESSLIGELKSFESLNSIGNLNSLEGWTDVRLSYLGGLSIQLEFASPSAASAFLEGAEYSWKDWFSSLTKWKSNFAQKRRIALLEILGIPLHVWNKESLSKIGSSWGEVLASELEGDKGFKKTSGFIHVLTDRFDWITEVVEVLIGGSYFRIRVVERYWDHWELGEILNSGSESCSVNSSDEESSWGSSSRNVFNRRNSGMFATDPSSAAQEGSGNAPDSRAAAEIPEMSPTKVGVEASPLNLGIDEDLMHDQVPSMVKELNDESVLQLSGDSSKRENFSADGVHVDSKDGFSLGSDQAVLGVNKSNNSKKGHYPLGPDPEFNLKNMGSPLPRPVNMDKPITFTGRFGDSPINFLDDASETLPSEDEDDEISWHSQIKIDGLERHKRRIKKWKKFKSPCNCGRRNRGWRCKHDSSTGCLVEDAFAGNRDDQASSDSEVMIRRSNKRFLVSNSQFGQEWDMLKILSWNINGMGKDTKCKWVKDLVAEHKTSFVCLQETKTVIKEEWQVAKVWGKPNMDYSSLDSVGNSAGILTVWDGNLFKMHKSSSQEGFVAVIGHWQGNNKKLGLINVYAPQEANCKKELWCKISAELQSEPDAAWVVCGDFNEVRCEEERKGSIFDPRGARHFNNFITTSSLLDVKLGGRKFTWMNSSCTKLSKLDRFLVNSEFVDIWASTSSFALPRCLSDHCPIILDSNFIDFGPTPFKLFNSWLNNPEFAEVVKEKWTVNKPEFDTFSKIEKLSRKLRYLKTHIKEWIAKTRKASDEEVSSLKHKICAIDLLAETNSVDDNLAKERADYRARLNDLLAVKLMDTKQKAKVRWLAEGDENSRFFHGIVNKKLKTSRIHGLNFNGIWESDPGRLKAASWEFFAKKFHDEHPVRPVINSPHFKKISDSQRSWLELPFTEQEVKAAVWKCGNNKAPGPDGFTIEFVRKFWEVVGNDFYEAVKSFEINRQINPGSNSSFISLIPKVSDPLSLDDYRPINLIGCVNKIISKVLAERLKCVLGTVISNTQTAFIKGRSILDGPLMVNELISWAKKARRKLLLFKVDFAKAFDSLNWNYLDNVMLQMGFGDTWRAWMKCCLSTAKVSVLINGAPTKEFKMSKGVRQGDPLAPFLFILAAEGLAAIMKEAQRSNIFHGVRLPNESVDVSLFQFADDAVLVGDWNLNNAKNLIRILKCFEICSGLKINLSKCRIVGVSVLREDVVRMARRLNCKEESLPFHYLGLPVGGNMNIIKNWQPLVDKFRKKLSAWKVKSLSIGGRLCLCKAVLGTLGTYMFSLYKAPKKVLIMLEGLRRKFFWGGVNGEKKICWLAWDKVVRSKTSGGLGIGSLRALNLAMLAKWHWRDKTEPDAQWRAVVRGCNGIHVPRHGTWRSILRVENDLRELGINLSTHLKWKDEDGGWVWDLDSSKSYTVRSLRMLIDGISLPIADMETDWVRWLPGKVNIQLWRVLNNRLPTRDNLQNRGLILNSILCPLCLSTAENLDHLLCSCSTTKTISAYLMNWVDWWPTNEQTVVNMWEKIRSSGANTIQKDVFKLIGAAFINSIWMTRNKKIFNGDVKAEKEIFRDIQALAFTWVRSRSKGGNLLSWEAWLCNPANAVVSCTALAPR